MAKITFELPDDIADDVRAAFPQAGKLATDEDLSAVCLGHLIATSEYFHRQRFIEAVNDGSLTVETLGTPVAKITALRIAKATHDAGLPEATVSTAEIAPKAHGTDLRGDKAPKG